LLEQRRRQGQGGFLRQVVAVGDEHRDVEGGPVAHALHDLAARVGRHDDARARVFQLVPQLVGLVHGIERDGDGPDLERAEVGHRELGAVLEIERHPVARADATAAEPGREPVARLVQLGERDLPAVEDQRRLARKARGGCLELRGQRVVGKPDARLVDTGGPVRLPDPIHGPDTNTASTPSRVDTP
jgi:hypothetical protein